MSPSPYAVARVCVALVAVTSAVLAMLGPALLTGLVGATAGEASATATLAVVALALATLVRLGAHAGVLAGRVAALVPVTGPRPAPLLRTRVCDPVHHPRRPRAPGTA